MKEKYMNPAQIEARESETSKTGKKETIIKTGIRLVMEKGIQNISVEDITKTCGYSKGTFYYYFSSKDDFLLSAIRGFNIDDAYNEAKNAEGLSVSGRIALYMKRYAEIMHENIGIEFCRIWARLVLQYQSTERYYIDLEQVEALLQDAVNAGELREDMNVRDMARMLLTYVYGAAFEWHMDETNNVIELTELFIPCIERILGPFQSLNVL